MDGRGALIPGYEQGYFLRPTILDEVPLGSTIATTEVFGPVMGIINVNTVDDAIAAGQQRPLRQHGLHLYLQRGGGAQVPL